MKNKASGGVLETIKTFVYAIVIAIIIRTVLYEPFNIPSASMEPTLLIGDYLFVSKFSYGYSRYSLPFGLPLMSGRLLFREPERGDVIVFKLPKDQSPDYIKRLIGLPGDRIQMKHGILYINDAPVKRERTDNCNLPLEEAPRGETFRYWETLPNGVRHCIIERGDEEQLDNTGVFVIQPGHYFMMGDNRDNSSDSRDPNSGVGQVPAENLVGRAEFIFFSHDPSAAGWTEPWKWPEAIRFSRFFTAIH
jgi:signal peptidase I